MTSDVNQQGRAGEEAARWFARLNATSVSVADLTGFRAWRQSPENDAAYAAVEGVWRKSGALAQDPDIQRMVAEAQARADRREDKERGAPSPSLIAGGGAIVALLAATVVLGSGMLGGKVYQTAVGQRRSVVLSDGSRVSLDTNSRIEVRYTARLRSIVLLRGQALFDVTHLPQQPLRVLVGSTVVRDLGTRFDVRRGAQQVQVTVIEGCVQVGGKSASAPRWTMRPGEQMTAGAAVRPPHAVNLVQVTSWTTGRLVFDDLPLSAATDELNRYGAHKVVLDADGVGDIHVSGTFDPNDTEGFVAAVSRLYDLTARRRFDGAIVLSARAKDRPI